MSTEYEILVRAPGLSESRQVLDCLATFGATDFEFVEWDEFPDRWKFSYEGLGNETEVINLAADYESHDDPDDFDFGFPIEVMIGVPFRNDNALTRKIVMDVAAHLAKSFEVLVVYNTDTALCRNDQPGGAVYQLPDSDTSFVADDVCADIKTSGLLPGNIRPSDVGL